MNKKNNKLYQLVNRKDLSPLTLHPSAIPTAHLATCPAPPSHASPPVSLLAPDLELSLDPQRRRATASSLHFTIGALKANNPFVALEAIQLLADHHLSR